MATTLCTVITSWSRRKAAIDPERLPAELVDGVVALGQGDVEAVPDTGLVGISGRDAEVGDVSKKQSQETAPPSCSHAGPPA